MTGHPVVVTTDPEDGGPPDEGVRPHGSRAVRIALVTAGTSSLALGVIGIFVPVLPTTPFVLLAAGCYARASTRLHGWLLRSRAFGPMIREWETRAPTWRPPSGLMRRAV